ncbi:hypothetical protein PoB_007414000 [Plakobranchus ocellatus]|uniref:Uncharacterized protein n=1 Tax=Plakobranchus ocellatus TaxID=259542 RepID=A0AAV4DU07_9GAST|nr:hypothetical protein PoB_007414000 [Plakobranchus ocellatus]
MSTLHLVRTLVSPRLEGKNWDQREQYDGQNQKAKKQEMIDREIRKKKQLEDNSERCSAIPIWTMDKLEKHITDISHMEGDLIYFAFRKAFSTELHMSVILKSKYEYTNLTYNIAKCSSATPNIARYISDTSNTVECIKVTPSIAEYINVTYTIAGRIHQCYS